MTSYTRLWGLFAAVAVGWAVLAIEGCNGFGTTCSSTPIPAPGVLLYLAQTSVLPGSCSPKR